jgi:hypothetical protein
LFSSRKIHNPVIDTIETDYSSTPVQSFSGTRRLSVINTYGQRINVCKSKYIVGGFAMKKANQGCQCDSDRGQRLLNQSEVAEILCVSPKTLEYWRWKDCGGPKFVKIGKLARYRWVDVQTYMDELGK